MSDRRRRWWAIAADPDLPALSRARAYGEVLGVYLAFFGGSIVAAGLILANRSQDLTDSGSWGIYMAEAVSVIGRVGLVVAVVLLLASRRGVGPAALGLRLPRRPDGRVAASRTVRIIGWCFFAQVAGGIVNALLQTGHLPDNHANAAQDLFSVVDSIQAGVVEELVVLAFVVVTLRQAGRPWWEVTAAALVLRGAYHIYYGPGVFGILIWAALFYWIYLRFRTILPLIVTHALWDMVAFLGRAAIGVAVVGELLILAIWLASFILWLIERNNPAGGPWPHVVGAGAYAGVGPGGYAGVGPEGYAGHGSHQAPVAVPFAGHGSHQAPVAVPFAGNGSHQAPVAVPFAGLPPPGWHPDPSGLNRWRWWDGQRWTDHVSQHSAR